MPEPANARSLSRVSKRGLSAMLATTSSGMPRSASMVRRICLSAGTFSAIDSTPLGKASVSRLSIRMTNRGPCAAAKKGVEHLAGTLRALRSEAERPAVEVRQMRDVVQGGGDVVDRHDVGVTQLGAG